MLRLPFSGAKIRLLEIAPSYHHVLTILSNSDLCASITILGRTYRFTRSERRTPREEIKSEDATPIDRRHTKAQQTEHPDPETSASKSKTRRLICRPATVPDISRRNLHLSIGCGDVSERSHYKKQKGIEEGGRRTRGRQRNFQLPNDLQPWKPPLLFQFCKVDTCLPCLDIVHLVSLPDRMLGVIKAFS